MDRVDTKSVAKLYLVVMVLSGGVTGATATEYRKATEMERVTAYCDEAAAQAERGHFAFGSPMFVAGAGIGAAIRRSIDHQRAFDNCMTMHGYAKVDGDGDAPVQTRVPR